MLKSMKRKIVYGLMIIAVLLYTLVSFMPTSFNVQADEIGTTNSNEYIGYSNYKGEALDIYSKATSYKDVLPAITCLVHGQGGNVSNWSNEEGTFNYDDESLIEQIRMVAGEGAIIYKAEVQMKCTDKIENHNVWKTEGNKTYYHCTKSCERGFVLKQLTNENNRYVERVVDKITDFEHHAIILFEATSNYTNGDKTVVIYGGRISSHEIAYMELECVLDTILADYRYVTGVLPKLNLISHSRGGILSMKYATEHPYNVSNLISMGTPYNGAIFAQSDWIIGGLGLKDAIECPSGQDIVSQEMQTTLKTEWNNMLASNPTANINAVAIGSKASVDFISGMLAGDYLNEYTKIKKSWLNDLLGALTKFSGAAIAKLHEDYPIITDLIFQCVDIAVDIGQVFMGDNYTSEQIEALRQIIYNCEIAYGDLVIKDDLFIDFASQTATGYEGFSRIEFVFTSANANYEKTSTNAPPVVHNLEARDAAIINRVLGILSYGTNLQAEYNVDTYDNQKQQNFSSGYYTKMNFTATYEGSYIINSSSALHKVLTDDSGNVMVSASDAGITFNADKGKVYSLYISVNESNQTVNSTVVFQLSQLSSAQDITLNSGEETTFYKSFSNSEIKNIYFGDINFHINVYVNGELTETSNNGTIQMLFSAGNEYYFEVLNPSTAAKTISVTIGDVTSISKDVKNNREISNRQIMSFVGRVENDYTVAFTWETNVLTDIMFYSNAFAQKPAQMVVNLSEQKIFKIHLSSNEKIYIDIYAPESISSDCNVTVEVNEYLSDYSWKIDDEPIENGILEIKRNNTYLGELSFYYNGQLLEGQILPVTDSNAYINLSGSRIKVYNNTPLTYSDSGYQYVVWQNEYGDSRLNEALKIKVLPSKKIALSAANIYDYRFNLSSIDQKKFGTMAESVGVTVLITDYMGNTYEQYISVGATTSKSNILVGSIYDYFRSKTIRLKVVEMTYSYNGQNITYNIDYYPALFSSTTISLDGYFSGGSGSVGEPYLITNERELNNIRKATKTSYEYDSSYEVISYSFKLMNSITLSTSWTPIEYKFRGDFDGNYNTISGLNFSASTSGKNYGFFQTVDYGTVKNLYFANVNISGSTNNNADVIIVGAVAGTNNYGNIENCDVKSGKIGVYTYNAWIGGVVGFNCSGKVKDSDNLGAIILGYGILGGVAGINSMGGTVDYCSNRADIRYSYNTDNGSVGGIVGKNQFTAEVTNCTNNGKIKYESASSNDTAIAPHMGQIIGWMVDGIKSNNICNGSTDYSNLKASVGGFLGIGAKNQKRYCTTGEVGRTGE